MGKSLPCEKDLRDLSALPIVPTMMIEIQNQKGAFSGGLPLFGITLSCGNSA